MGFPLPGGNASFPDDSDSMNMTCYKGGDVVFQNHQMCDVTSASEKLARYLVLIIYKDPGIIRMLPDKPPQVTFSCDTSDNTCLFQFWVNRVESFYCGLDTCKYSVDPATNSTRYDCDKIQCSCIPDRFLCGEEGSVSAYRP